MESTKEKRVWHKGPPPHVGWWNASKAEVGTCWRWWDGRWWSAPAHSSDLYAGVSAAKEADYSDSILWSDYWPENARVPRIDPNAPQPVAGIPVAGSRWRRKGGNDMVEVLAVTDFKDLIGKAQVPHVLFKRVGLGIYPLDRVECVRLKIFKAKAEQLWPPAVLPGTDGRADYEAAMAAPRLAKRAKILTAQGYRRTSNAHGMVSRIDRPDWVDVLAEALHRSPADFYKHGEATPAASWCDHYRRGYSKDTLTVGQELAKLVPTSGGDATGYIPSFKGEIA